MTKPVGFFGLSPEKNQLIQAMVNEWGNDLSGMNENDVAWLISRIGHDLWMGSDDESGISEDAEEVSNRLHELTRQEKIQLIRALAQEA
ncbi:MAG: hypothetical protein QNJ36_01235 [Calothrix sp. MO_167.B42]|nr:hypothetical protein [Calothrix sp. MO_167.B42]